VAGLARGSIAAAATTKASLTDAVAAADGTFQFKLGPTGAVVSVAVSATTTLDQLIQAINEENAGIKATAVNLGTPAAPAWKLTLTSVATGAANDIVIVDDDTTLAVANTQAALDASFNVAGLGDFTRATNTFADVVEGVTVTLKGAGAADLAVEIDKGGTQARLQELVEAYNQVVRTIDQQAAATRGSDGKLTPGAFTGDVVPRQLRASLAAILRTTVGGSLGTLADLGITTSKSDGTLSIDKARLQQALADDSSGVAALVSGTGTADGIADLLSRALETATQGGSGAIAARRDGLSASIRSVERQIDAALTRLESTERLLRARFTALEKTVSQLQSTGSSLLSALAGLSTQT
jgi:flagellar hook-associated protein 2